MFDRCHNGNWKEQGGTFRACVDNFRGQVWNEVSLGEAFDDGLGLGCSLLQRHVQRLY